MEVEEQERIAIIDSYGLHTISPEVVREAVGLQVGDATPDAVQVKSIVRKLEAIPGVQRAAAALIEMSRWTFDGHALMAFLLIGRVAGLTDEEIAKAWGAGAREAVIAGCQKPPPPGRRTPEQHPARQADRSR
ncbi:MAG: hypothetical protein HY000_26705 [Planctomycetes bacterium]|nr:hypothetical protein [Planctomycetota bacterium]